jgi:hypothetical protein
LQEESTDPSKKQYFGLLGNGEVFNTKLIGMKSNYPKYFNDTIWGMIDKDVIEEFYLDDNLRNSQSKDQNSRIANMVRDAFWTLDEMFTKRDMKFIIQNLAFTQDNNNPLYTYQAKYGWQQQIFKEILEDCNGDHALAEMKSQAHIIHPHWKIVFNDSNNNNRKTVTTHPERYALDEKYYKSMLWMRIKPILDSYLFTKEECDRLKTELIDYQEKLN